MHFVTREDLAEVKFYLIDKAGCLAPNPWRAGSLREPRDRSGA